MSTFLIWKTWLVFKEFGSLPNPVTGASISTGDSKSPFIVQHKQMSLHLELRQNFARHLFLCRSEKERK
jgi:hypothetical protein